MRVEEAYLDVLQNIEAGIVVVYRAAPSLLDLVIDDAFEALVREYGWEEQGRGAGRPKLSAPAEHVYQAIRRICEWRLGRGPLDAAKPEAEGMRPQPISVSEGIACLKRLRKSVRFWQKEGGRQGYLNYVRQFLPDAKGRGGV